MGYCCSVVVGLDTFSLLGCDGTRISHKPSQWFRSPYITTSLSFISHIFWLLINTLQKLSYNCPSDNREKLFKPGTIVTMVASDDGIIDSGREPWMFACNVPESGIVIIGRDSLKMLFKQCWYYSLMKFLDAPLPPFNMTWFLLVFNIALWGFCLGIIVVLLYGSLWFNLLLILILYPPLFQKCPLLNRLVEPPTRLT